LTYQQLDHHATHLAHHLTHHTTTPETTIALLMERSAHLVVAIVAILKAGGTYVPLDPEWPLERMRYVVRDIGVKALITDSALSTHEAVAGLGLPVIVADRVECQQSPARFTPATRHADQLAYVMYTSGSTGRPKAV